MGVHPPIGDEADKTYLARITNLVGPGKGKGNRRMRTWSEGCGAPRGEVLILTMHC